MIKNLLQTRIGQLRIMAFVEGLSFLIILFVTMPLKYMADMPEPNRLIGMIHGILFIAYVAMVILLKKDANWSMKTTFWALLASIVPFGTFVADHKIFKLTEIKSDK